MEQRGGESNYFGEDLVLIKYRLNNSTSRFSYL